MLSELDDLRTAAQVMAKANFAGAPGSVAANAAVDLEEIRSMVDAAQTNALSAVNASKEYAVDGHASTAAWFQWHCRLPRDRARKRAKQARNLRAMPETWAALASGAIGDHHVDFLARANRRGLAEAFARDEHQLVGWARAERFSDFVNRVKYWEAVNAPDEHEREATDAEASREFHNSRTFEGMHRLDGWLPPVGGAEFTVELDRIERALFEQDWKEARARLGDQATAADLCRTPAQRRADALVEMARRSAMVQGMGRSPKYILNLLMDYPTFCAEMAHFDGERDVAYPPDRTCELEDGTVIPPSQMLSLGLQGQVRRVVLGPMGEILDFGRTKRLFDGALREALIIRDRHCQHEPGCDVPARRCEADHRREWWENGTTSVDNGDMYCDRHNRWKHNKRRRC